MMAIYLLEFHEYDFYVGYIYELMWLGLKGVYKNVC